MAQSAAGPAPGVIPYRLWVGVTGHRTLPDDPALIERVKEAVGVVQNMAPSSPSTTVHVGVVSALAEGTDRIVAREVLAQPGGALEVALPLPTDEYVQDFETDASVREFNGLLARGAIVTSLSLADSRSHAYERVGEYVVDRCDALIALWDGKPQRGQGGTAGVVELARKKGVPLLWVQTEAPFDLVVETGSGLPDRAFKELDAYNHRPMDAEHVERSVVAQSEALLAQSDEVGFPQERLRPFLAWLLPFMVRADLLAGRYQKLYYRLGNALFMAAAAAVMVVAFQFVFWPELHQLASIEVAIMVGLLVGLTLARRRRVHRRWISYRALAEQLRTTLFTALAGVGTGRETTAEGLLQPDEAEDWLRRAFEEVWIARPHQATPPSETESLKRFLSAAWVGDQAKYHRRAGHRHHSKERRLTLVIEALFGLTLLAAIVHAGGWLEPKSEPPAAGPGTAPAAEAGGSDTAARWVVVLSISLPAIAGGLSGIRAQREYVRNAERSRRMASNLESVQARLDAAQTLTDVRNVARTAEDTMLEENQDWFGVMRVHDFELHV